jgi:hypothetical protein
MTTLTPEQQQLLIDIKGRLERPTPALYTEETRRAFLESELPPTVHFTIDWVEETSATELTKERHYFTWTFGANKTFGHLFFKYLGNSLWHTPYGPPFFTIKCRH